MQSQANAGCGTAAAHVCHQSNGSGSHFEIMKGFWACPKSQIHSLFSPSPVIHDLFFFQ
jgi:hypothetical protein